MKRNPSLLDGRRFDVLVCGGGVYGAWTAYDAALRGLSVALVDQGDWAQATSSASSKLVHGGLRYLEQFEFGLVRKTLAEREMLMHVAPHRVWPLNFSVPVYTHSRVGLWRLKLGLMMYDFLATGHRAVKRHRYFNPSCFSKCFPAVNDDALKGGFTYTDAQTDDARLVLELVYGAIDAGAVCVNYCKLTDVLTADQQTKGAKVQDVLTADTHEVHARQIVYTTGHWIAADSQRPNDCLLTRGIHLMMPRLKLDPALLLTAQSDGRVFFVIPWYGVTLLGTTDTPCQDVCDGVVVEQAEVDYLLDAVNDYLRIPWTHDDIIGRFSGVRVLKQAAAEDSIASPSSVSRDWILETASNGVHYSIGGKLTSARQDAAQIVDRVCTALDARVPCATHNQFLPWSPQYSEDDQMFQDDFSGWSQVMQVRATQLGVDAESALWLIRRHGSKATTMLNSIEQHPTWANRIMPTLPLIDADLIHCATHEMTVHLDDLLRRRLPLLILAKLTVTELRDIAEKVSAVLSWDASKLQREVARCQEYLNP